MTPGTSTGIAKWVGWYIGPTSYHHREKTWLQINLPQKKRQAKMERGDQERIRRKKAYEGLI